MYTRNLFGDVTDWGEPTYHERLSTVGVISLVPTWRCWVMTAHVYDTVMLNFVILDTFVIEDLAMARRVFDDYYALRN